MVLIGEIVHRPFGHPTTVALVPATFLEPPQPGPVQFGHPAFRRIACLPILPAAAVPAVVCHSAGSIDFAPADFVVAAVSAATVVEIAAADPGSAASFDFVGSADSVDFVVAVAGSGFVVDYFVAGSVAVVVAAGSVV